ncbi:MAG: response regulator [Endomicrobiia bacterium]
MQKSVLIIEDNTEVKALLRFVVQKEGYIPYEAENGRKALVLLGLENPISEEEKKLPKLPDLILLDIMLPEIDGYTFITKLQSDTETSKIPIIIVTAKQSVADLFITFPNIRHFFTKPFDIRILREKIKEILG